MLFSSVVWDLLVVSQHWMWISWHQPSYKFGTNLKYCLVFKCQIHLKTFETLQELMYVLKFVIYAFLYHNHHLYHQWLCMRFADQSSEDSKEVEAPKEESLLSNSSRWFLRLVFEITSSFIFSDVSINFTRKNGHYFSANMEHKLIGTFR